MKSIRLLAGLIVLSVLLVTSGWAAPKKVTRKAKAVPQKDVMVEAQKAWDKRDQPLQAELAIALWERALEAKPSRTEFYISLSKACGRVYRHVKDPAEKKYWADEGKKYGALAVEKNPNSAPAYAAYAEALGQWAQANKGIGSLKVVKQAVAQLEKSIAIDSKYAFAHMLLAQFYEKSPSMFSVGDKKKAMEQAKLAVEYGPEYAINHLTLAKIYLARGNKPAAKEQLEQTIALKAPADAIPETKADQEEAQELLKGLN